MVAAGRTRGWPRSSSSARRRSTPSCTCCCRCHAARLARARAHLQGPAGAAAERAGRDLGFLGYPPLQLADIRAYRWATDPGRRGPGRARRDHARDRAPLQISLRARRRDQGRGAVTSLGSKNASLDRQLRREYQEKGETGCARPAHALVQGSTRIAVADRERLSMTSRARPFIDPAGAARARRRRRREATASTVAVCRSPTATRSGMREDPDASRRSCGTTQTHPARVRRTDPASRRSARCATCTRCI